MERREEEAGLVADTNVSYLLLSRINLIEVASDGERNDDIKNFKPKADNNNVILMKVKAVYESQVLRCWRS